MKSHELLAGEEWNMLQKALREPVEQLLFARAESDAQVQELVRVATESSPARVHQIPYTSGHSTAASLVAELEALLAWDDGSAEPLLICYPEPKEPAPEAEQVILFWKDLNLLRERLGDLSAQFLLIALREEEQRFTQHADHLRRWFSGFFNLTLPQASVHPEDSQPQYRGLSSPDKALADYQLLQEQLHEVLACGEDSTRLVHRYFIPLFENAVSLGDLSYAERYLHKIETAGFMDNEAPRLAHPLFVYHLGRRHLSAASDIAQRHYQQAKRKTSERALWAFNLGKVAQEERDFMQARRYYEQSLEINIKLGNEHRAGASYHNLGVVAQEERDFTQARSYYEQSLEIELKLGNEHRAATSYHQLGRIAEEEHDLQKALTFYGKAYVALDSMNDPHNSGIAMGSIKSLLPKLTLPETTLSQLLTQSGLSPDQMKQVLDS